MRAAQVERARVRAARYGEQCSEGEDVTSVSVLLTFADDGRPERAFLLRLAALAEDLSAILGRAANWCVGVNSMDDSVTLELGLVADARKRELVGAALGVASELAERARRGEVA